MRQAKIIGTDFPSIFFFFTLHVQNDFAPYIDGYTQMIGLMSTINGFNKSPSDLPLALPLHPIMVWGFFLLLKYTLFISKRIKVFDYILLTLFEVTRKSKIVYQKYYFLTTSNDIRKYL